jgi:hypothetical protein
VHKDGGPSTDLSTLAQNLALLQQQFRLTIKKYPVMRMKNMQKRRAICTIRDAISIEIDGLF